MDRGKVYLSIIRINYENIKLVVYKSENNVVNNSSQFWIHSWCLRTLKKYNLFVYNIYLSMNNTTDSLNISYKNILC